MTCSCSPAYIVLWHHFVGDLQVRIGAIITAGICLEVKSFLNGDDKLLVDISMDVPKSPRALDMYY